MRCFMRRPLHSTFKWPGGNGTAWYLAIALACAALPALALSPAQLELPKASLKIGQTSIEAEIADEPQEQSTGLMGRTALEEGQGMLFVFASPQHMNFWMKDTLIPLSIAYINAEGIIREIYDMQPLDESPVPSILHDLLYALEVPVGWFQRNGILPGDRVSGLPRPISLHNGQ